MTIIPISHPLVSIQEGEARTTSLVMAEGTDNEHASVILLVRKYQADLEEFGLLDFKSESSAGRPTEYATLNQEQATLLMTYMRNTEIIRTFKKALVKAFFDLARRQNQSLNPANLSRLQLLEMAIQSEQERLALECKVAEIEPKAMALDRIETRGEGSLCLTNAAKSLQIRPKTLIDWMSLNRWIYRRAGNKNWIGYQDRLQSGLLEHKVTTVQKDDGTEKVCEQVLVTAKGLAKLAQIIQGEVA